jgi:hypothetical protein
MAMLTITSILVRKALRVEPVLEVAAVVVTKMNTKHASNKTRGHDRSFRRITGQLSLAAGSLLALPHAQAEGEGEAPLYSNWDLDVGYLYYEEPDYVTVDTYMAMISGNLSDKDTIKLGLVFDTLSGATPSGALPDSETVSVSGVSGGGVSGAGSSGGKVAFDDTRLSFDVQWGHEWARLWRSKLGTYVSVEGDYTALGGSLGVEKDAEDKSYTLTAALGLATDKVSRSDETTPEPLSEVGGGQTYGQGTKHSIDALFGLTYVINRRTQAMFNLTFSESLGYHTDPYKIISVADADDVELTQVSEYRPDVRTRVILYTKIKHELPSSGHHLGLTYRYHQDDWDLNSHTFEGTYNFPLSNKHVLEPFARIYHQSAANFYTRTIEVESGSVFDDITLPQYASADIRLSEMQTATLGTKYIYKTSSNTSIDTRIGYYHRNYTDAIINDDGAYFVQLDFSKAFN